eukprot:13940465-Alexandrium_andersonii.AAC.1
MPSISGMCGTSSVCASSVVTSPCVAARAPVGVLGASTGSPSTSGRPPNEACQAARRRLHSAVWCSPLPPRLS